MTKTYRIWFVRNVATNGMADPPGIPEIRGAFAPRWPLFRVRQLNGSGTSAVRNLLTAFNHAGSLKWRGSNVEPDFSKVPW